MTLRIMLATAFTAAASSASAGAGYFNMPTTLPQCLGYGCGPGYHATMVLKPCYYSSVAGKGVYRAAPQQYPPIYHPHVVYGGFGAPSSLAHAEGYAHEQPPLYAPARAVEFAAPSLRTHAPQAMSYEPVPAEPASPSDSFEPDELPAPR